MAKYDIFDRCWKVLRNDGAIQSLVNNELVPTPNVSSADFFGLFSVFVKPKDKVFTRLRPVYHVIGHVGQVAQLEKTNMNRLLDNLHPHNETTPWLSQYKWEADVILDDKMVHLTLHGVTKLVLPLNFSQGDVYLNMAIPELTSVRTVYIITDVLKASSMTAAVSGDDDSMSFQNLDKPIPVGFGYKKFRLNSDGCICEEMTSGFRLDGKWRVVNDQLAPYLNELPPLDDGI